MKPFQALKKQWQRTLQLNLALRFVWSSTRKWTVINLVLIVFQAPLPLLSLYLTKLMVDAVTATLASGGDDFKKVGLYVAITAGVSLFGALLGLLGGLASEAQALTVSDHMYDVVHAKSIEVDLEYYENPQYYDTLRRAQTEAPFRPLKILRGLTALGQSSISLIGIAGLLFSLYWGIAAILFVVVLPGIGVRLLYSRRLYHWQRQRTSTERRAWYFNWMLTTDTHAKEIRLFDLGDEFIQRFRGLREQLRQEKLQISTRRSAAEFAAQVLTTLGVYGAYAVIGYQTVQGTITLGDLVMYFQAFQRGQGFLREMLGSLASLYEDNLFLSNLFEFLDLEPKITPPAHPKPIPRPMRRGVVFDHVRFQYPNGTRTVLEDVSFAIQPGEKIALVGENGSGKTTLIKLLCRLYDPTGGTITVDGIDLREFDPATLRSEIGVVFQDYARYNLTARENIWFGNIALPADTEQIITSAQNAGASQVISGLKHGYDTILGKMFEEGEELSIGEWQKVALARAFLRDSQITILDEPTSAMDARAEHETFEKLCQLAEGKTVILISHRFSTVRIADRILVLSGGQIIERGTHEELLRYDGTYAHLYTTQAQHYH